jgi:hypothetical protein
MTQMLCTLGKSDQVYGGMVIEAIFFEYGCLAVVEGKPCITMAQSEYDTRTLWRVEMSFDHGLPGALVYPQSIVRLRHLSEQLYLCREADGSAALTSSCWEPSAQWQLEIQGSASQAKVHTRHTRILSFWRGSVVHTISS